MRFPEPGNEFVSLKGIGNGELRVKRCARDLDILAANRVNILLIKQIIDVERVGNVLVVLIRDTGSKQRTRRNVPPEHLVRSIRNRAFAKIIAAQTDGKILQRSRIKAVKR